MGRGSRVGPDDAGASRPGVSKKLTLAACILGSAVVFLDGTVVNVALPAIRSDLGAGLDAQQWIVEAYLLTLGALLLIGGSLGDLLGRRRVFGAGVAAFGALSLLCALAPTAELLIAARALQGAAGALLVPSTLALLMDTFPEEERGGAIGSWTAWTGVATVVGPLVGGILIDAASWRWIFAINVPAVAATLWLLRFAPAGRQVEAHVDVPGAVLCTFGLAGPVFALIEQPRYGFSSAVVLVPLLAGLAFLGAFLWWERRSPEPMLPLRLFRSRNFAIGNAATVAIYGGLGAAMFFVVLFLQQVADYSALAAGLALMPVTIVMFLLSKRFGGLADRYGPRLFMGIGPIVAGTGLLLFVAMDRDADYLTQVLPGALVFGLGLALTVAPLTAAVLGAVEEGHSGLASGVNNAVARVAGLVAIAAVGAVVAARFGSELDSKLPAGLGERTEAVAERARERPLVVDTSGAAPREQAALADALETASLGAFRVGLGGSGALVVLGGLVALAGIQNPRREVLAGECPAGAICGASRDVARAPAAARVEAGAATAAST